MVVAAASHLEPVFEPVIEKAGFKLVRMSDVAIIARNDDWATATNAAELQLAGFAPSDAREPAIGHADRVQLDLHHARADIHRQFDVTEFQFVLLLEHECAYLSH